MKKLGLALFCLFFALANSSVAVADSLYTRNLSCDSWTAPREQEICKALAREMQWTWTGHAIISPSFRVTFDTVKQVYCALSVSPQDTHALVNMIVALERKPDGSMARAQAVNGLASSCSCWANRPSRDFLHATTGGTISVGKL
jgi:hypothetical protein